MVAQIHVVLESERDLSIGEQPTGRVFVIQPLEDRLERVKAAIEGEHKLRSWCLCLCGGHGNFVYSSTCLDDGGGEEGAGNYGQDQTRVVMRD
jgi:hypothetical protein